MSYCQLEIDIPDYNDVECQECNGDFAKIAPLRILSFDIECAAKEGGFPEARKDPVIQIANICKVHGDEEPMLWRVYNLRSCAPIPGAEVMEYSSETDMLKAWRDFIIEMDPDIITGYNIGNFDLPYLIEWAEALKIDKFAQFSKVKDRLSRVKSNTFSSKALGTWDNKDVSIEGRI